MTPSVERIGDMRCKVGESPVWHPEEQSLYWTDIPERTLWRWDAATGGTHRWIFPEMTGCFARMATSGWLLAMETGLFMTPDLVPGDAWPSARQVAGVAHIRPDMRFNDGRCDRQGRFWAGTMVLDISLGQPAGKLYRFDPADASLNPFVTGLVVPNGLAFSPDGTTMYLSDSHPARQAIWAFDYDADEGRPGNRRLFIDMRQYPGRPDGAAVDAQGCYWICGNDAGLVHRFSPDGVLIRSIAIPAAKPAMCAFGGSRLDTLFVTTIRQANSGEDMSGAVFALQPGVAGLQEPMFRAA